MHNEIKMHKHNSKENTHGMLSISVWIEFSKYTKCRKWNDVYDL
jgi:hypothetical protein